MDKTLLFLIAFAASAATVAGLAAWLAWRRRHPSENPLQAAVETALRPHLIDAIVAAYRLSEWAMDQTQSRLHGLDKKAIADAAYTLLPPTVGRFPLALVKTLVPPDRWRALVQTVIDDLDRQFDQAQAHYHDLFTAWLADQQDPHAPNP